MAKFRVETQLAIDKASTQAAKASMEVLSGVALKMFAVLGGAKLMTAPIKAYIGMIEDSIAASEKASAAQDRMQLAIKNVYKTIGDEMTPGLNELATSIQQALANPEVIKGLQSMGQLLALVAGGIARTVTDISNFVGSPEFSKWLQFLYGVDLDGADLKAYREHGAMVDQVTEAVLKWAKGVGEQQKAEEKAAEVRKRAHDAHLKALEQILDKVNPIAKAERETWQQILTLNQALKAGEIDVNTYQQALAYLTTELNKVKTAADIVAATIATLDLEPRDLPTINTPLTGGSMTISQSPFVEEMMRAEEQFTDNLAQGMGAAAATFAREFLETGELNIKALGDMLLDVLLDAAMQYFAQMVTNQANLQMSSGATGSTGAGGMNAGMSALGNVAMAAAVVYAVYAITDGIRKANNAGKFKETAVAGVYRGGVGSTYAGELSDQGRQMAEALRGFLNLMQSVAGSWITSMEEIGVRVSGDGKKFQALVGGEIIGTFASMSEAMVRAFQAAFSDATFATEIDPIIRDMVTNFRGTDIEELKAGLLQVKNVLNEVSGLSDVEIALKDLPFQADALKQSMVQLGASFDDASALAAKWQATQMGALRDQITGHQATEAEQRAQKEREALLFNAQLALNKAEIMMKRDKLAADIEILKAGGSLAMADLNLTTQYLGQVGRLSEVKAELLNQDLQIQQGHVNLMTAAGQAALASLNLQLEALNQVYAILDSIKPIDLAEIRIPRSGSGGGVATPSGPTEEELAQQHADAVAAFWADIAAGFRASTQSVGAALADLNAWYEEQAARARELGLPIADLNHLYAQQLLNLQRDTLASLGLESFATIQRFQALADALKYLRDWGAITEEQLRELGDSLYISLADGLLQYVENEEMRRSLEEMKFLMEMHNYELQFAMIAGLGILTEEQTANLKALFAQIWEDYGNGDLPFQQETASVNQTQTNGSGIDDARNAAEQALRAALDRLRNAIDGLREFEEGLTLSAVSPLTPSQQYEVAAQQYAQMLAAAQGGDLAAIEGLAGAAQTYLELAGQMFGTAGSGYGAIFAAVQQQVAAIVAAGQGVLDGAPLPMQGTEQRLDTIAQILDQIRILYGGAPTWNPATTSAANFSGTGNLTTGNFGGGTGTPVAVRAPELVAELRALREGQAQAALEAKQASMQKATGGLSGFYGQPIGSKRSA